MYKFIYAHGTRAKRLSIPERINAHTHTHGTRAKRMSIPTSTHERCRWVYQNACTQTSETSRYTKTQTYTHTESERNERMYQHTHTHNTHTDSEVCKTFRGCAYKSTTQKKFLYTHTHSMGLTCKLRILQ